MSQEGQLCQWVECICGSGQHLRNTPKWPFVLSDTFAKGENEGADMTNRVASVYKGRYLEVVFRTFGRRFWMPPLAFLALYWVLPFVVLEFSSAFSNNGLVYVNSRS